MLVKHIMDDDVYQEVVAHTVFPTRPVGFVDVLPKLLPEIIIVVTPDDGPFTTGTYVSTGASKVKADVIVLTTPMTCIVIVSAGMVPEAVKQITDVGETQDVVKQLETPTNTEGDRS